ncbi:hypothetical protein D4764_07G0006600 [Takifugu flavidus]|uniref:Uncharacterized protein n=1 Tax=Takifugu flavidus TaxID=433684 RepID=A0A5C6MV27_9TELE|nr:hypothetical protein D4764_07G0006600 [Takifugu flavidus]
MEAKLLWSLESRIKGGGAEGASHQSAAFFTYRSSSSSSFSVRGPQDAVRGPQDAVRGPQDTSDRCKSDENADSSGVYVQSKPNGERYIPHTGSGCAIIFIIFPSHEVMTAVTRHARPAGHAALRRERRLVFPPQRVTVVGVRAAVVKRAEGGSSSASIKRE